MFSTWWGIYQVLFTIQDQSPPICQGEVGGGGAEFTLTGVLFIWHVRVFYILIIDMYKRLYCNRQLPGNGCVSSIIAIIQFSPVSYINKINNLFVLEIQM